MPDYTKSAKERFVEALNKANPESLIPSQVSNIIFGLPTPVAGSNGNTKITIQPLSLNGLIPFEGKRTVFYNRLDLTTFFGLVAETPLVVDTADTTHELLPLIYEQYNVRLLPEDIINEPIVTGIYRIRATATSLGWLGSVDLAADVSTVYNVLITDSGAAITLDSGAILLNA